ncbi:MAG: hypothetical protein HQL23_08860 [Candidatus Omnitrophica bacterium]|nr:hypothetical protein [Candidatus Omnitrophota bacterium]
MKLSPFRVRDEAAAGEMKNHPQNDDAFFLQAVLLSKVVTRVLDQRGDIVLSAPPHIEKVRIVEFRRRMRVWGLDKFKEKTYIATVNFYLSDKDLEQHKAVGALVVYIGEDYIETLLKKLGYPKIEDDDESLLEDACGTFTNIVAAKFKEGLTQLGFAELVMSHFSCFQNEALNGVEFDITQKEKYEIAFEIGGYKRIVVDLTLGKMPRVATVF